MGSTGTTIPTPPCARCSESSSDGGCEEEARHQKSKDQGAHRADCTRRREGAVIGTYGDPFGGKSLLIAILPIEKVEPTPFQRDVSDTHRKKLENVIAKTGRFLDPIVVVTAPKGGYWTPNVAFGLWWPWGDGMTTSFRVGIDGLDWDDDPYPAVREVFGVQL